MRYVIAIDPGHKKCGVVLADLNNLIVVDGKTAKKSSVIQIIQDWREVYNIELIIIGNGTTSKYWQFELLSNGLLPVQVVDENRTTIRAKARYLELSPPWLIFRWFPKTLILPPPNLDTVVALILIEDYFDIKLKWEVPIELKTWP